MRALNCLRATWPALFAAAATIAAVAMGALLVSNTPTQAYPFTDCSLHDFEHWYARAVSGEGSTVEGTMAATTTPLHWSVDSGSSSTWDEAAWAVHQNGDDISNSLEVGFFSGWWPYPPYGWTDGLVAYYTINNGNTGFRPAGANGYVPANTSINEAAVSSTGDLMAGESWVWNYFFPTSYAVAKPTLNLHQGEVVGISRTWMGGGVGEQFQGAWMDDRRLYIWGFHNDCASSPYWIQSLNYYTWKNGGYGN